MRRRVLVLLRKAGVALKHRLLRTQASQRPHPTLVADAAALSATRTDTKAGALGQDSLFTRTTPYRTGPTM